MNDRELLKMAAKAAGYDVEFMPLSGANIVSGERCGLWRPLEDDGDALRLAVKLDMKVYKGEAYPYRKEYADYPIHLGCAIDEDEEPDQYAATRRAIVCAAAAIGKAMP